MFSLITSPDGDSPVSTITNETLAALMQANHVDISRRIDELSRQVAITNGRLREAEKEIAVLKDRPRPSEARPAVSSSVGGDLDLNVKKLSAWIAGGLVASWGAVKLIWMIGDWLQKAGLR
jgi:hypothetical protein